MENNDATMVRAMHDAIDILLTMSPKSSYNMLSVVCNEPQYYGWFQNQSIADRLLCDIPFEDSDKLFPIHLYCMGMMDDAVLADKLTKYFTIEVERRYLQHEFIESCLFQCLVNKKLKSVVSLFQILKDKHKRLTNSNIYGIINNELTSFWGDDVSQVIRECDIQNVMLCLPNNLFSPSEKRYVLDYIQILGCTVYSQRYDVHKCQFRGKYLVHPSHATARIRVETEDFCDIVEFPNFGIMEMWWEQMKLMYKF